MGSSETVYNLILKAEKAMNYSEETYKALIEIYEKLLAVDKGILSISTVKDNEAVYSVVLTSMIYKAAMFYIVSDKSGNLAHEYPGFYSMAKSNDFSVLEKYGNELCINGGEIPSEEEIKALIMTFDADEAEEDKVIDVFDDIELEDELEDIEELEDVSEEDRNIEILRETWGEKLDSVIDGIMSTFKRLYESGYGLLSPVGILTNIGIIRATSDGSIKETGNKAIDVEVFNAILKEMPVGYNLYAGNGAEPDIKQIEKASEPVIYTDFHLQCMYGYLKLGVGDRNIGKYVKEHNINVEKSTKIKKYSDIVDWMRETLEYYFYKAYLDKGVQPGVIREQDYEITNQVNEELSHNFKNVIVVCERKKGVNTRIRICSDKNINVNKIKDTIESSLNIGTANSVIVKQIGEYSDGVLDLNIIYNDKKYSQDALFAYQVLDLLDEQGLKHSWDNVILGKRDDGTIMTYNFKDKRNPTYALYAESRSGKGVMTLTLLGSALADGCKVMYNDGKPDIGSVLADIAWKKGTDACVYNGVAGKGSEMLENRGTCTRKEQPFMFASEIPEGIFITEEEKQKFMLITTYLKGIQLICDTAAYRASQNLGSEDWVVAFVDECEQASVAEIDVVSYLERAEASRKEAKDENGKKIDLSKDEAYKFIRRYKDWLQSIESKFKTCITSTFGFANMTTFFIWQSTKFPEKYKKSSTIAKVVDSASGHIVKIVGRGAAVNYGSSVFGTPTSLKDANWYDSRFSGEQGGYFAIGKDVRSNNMKVFRPFNVYTDANNKGLILENAKAAGLTERDLIGVSLDHNGNVIPEVGFEGYTSKLLAKYGITVEQQLYEGFMYETQVIRELGYGNNLNVFMYDCINFDGKTESSSIEDLYSEDETIYSEKPQLEEQEEMLDFGDEDVGFEELSFENNKKHPAEIVETEVKRENTIKNYNNARVDFNKAINSSKEGAGDEVEVRSDYGDISITMVNGKEHVEIDGRDTNVIKLSKNNSVDIGKQYISKFDKFKDKLMESSYGVNYQFKKRWEAVLDAISGSFPNNTMVIRVVIYSDGIMVNNRIVDVSALTDDEYGIYLYDIVNFEKLFSRFKYIKELTIDYGIADCIYREYGVGASGFIGMFKRASKLELIIIDGEDGIQNITRQTLSSEYKELNRMGNEADTKQRIEQTAARSNKRYAEKGAGYARRVSGSTLGFSKNSMGRAKNSLVGRKNKKYVSGVFWISAAAVSATVGGIAFMVGKMFNKFK